MLRRLAVRPRGGGVRGIGLIAAVGLVADKATKAPFDPLGKVGAFFAARAQDHGVIFRNLGDTIACCPPMIISEREIDEILSAFGKALDETVAWLDRKSVVSGKRVSVSVDLGGSRIIKKKTNTHRSN